MQTFAIRDETICSFAILAAFIVASYTNLSVTVVVLFWCVVVVVVVAVEGSLVRYRCYD